MSALLGLNFTSPHESGGSDWKCFKEKNKLNENDQKNTNRYIMLMLFAAPTYLQMQKKEDSSGDGKKEQQYCIGVLTDIADPVLNALSKNQLRA